jgi:hypothetical protein
MLVQAGSPRAYSGDTLEFDSVDRCFAAMAAAGFVGFIAVVVWAWLSWAPQANPAGGLHFHGFSGETTARAAPMRRNG